MNKIICDICGTSYSENEERCPICGYSREFNDQSVLKQEDLLLDSDLNLEDFTAAAVPADENSEIPESVVPVISTNFADSDAKEENAEDADASEDDEDEEEEEEEERRSSPLLIILLVLVIIALLGVAGYIFVKYYMPAMGADATVPETTAAIVETTEPVDAAVPCTSLVMTSDSEVILEQEGAQWLINLVAMPENTTDEVTFESSDESVVTVSESGTVTAVGEGTAVITVTCGDQQVTMEVTCAFATETTVADVTEPSTDETEEATEAETEETTVPETEAPTEPAGELVLKLHKSDISFNSVGVLYRLKVTEGIDPADVEWTSTNGNVAFAIDGVVQVVGPGTATIVATYNGQEAKCIIRVSLGGATSGSGSTTSGGTTSGGTTSGGATSGGATSGGTTSGGATSGGTTSGGTTSGGTTSGGTTSGGTASGTGTASSAE